MTKAHLSKSLSFSLLYFRSLLLLLLGLLVFLGLGSWRKHVLESESWAIIRTDLLHEGCEVN